MISPSPSQKRSCAQPDPAFARESMKAPDTANRPAELLRTTAANAPAAAAVRVFGRTSSFGGSDGARAPGWAPAGPESADLIRGRSE